MAATITREELRDKLQRGEEFFLVETLPEEKFEQAHLPGAINLPPQAIGELAPKRVPDRNAEIVVYCSGPT